MPTAPGQPVLNRDEALNTQPEATPPRGSLKDELDNSLLKTVDEPVLVPLKSKRQPWKPRAKQQFAVDPSTGMRGALPLAEDSDGFSDGSESMDALRYLRRVRLVIHCEPNQSHR
jgi:hypothetical protein